MFDRHFEFEPFIDPVDWALMCLLNENLIEMSVDEDGEFVFFANDIQKQKLEEIMQEGEEQGW